MKVLLLESYYGGSHQFFIDQIKIWLEKQGITAQLFTLPPRHWKSRIQLGHLELSHQVNEYLKETQPNPHEVIFLGNSLMDLSGFRSLLLDGFRDSKIWCYFHENQMSYPLDPNSSTYERDKVNQTHILPAIHLNQVLSADKIIFNSQFTFENTFQGLTAFLKSRPEKNGLNNLQTAKARSHVIPVGISFCPQELKLPWETRPHRVLWNHRWEYDKGPKDFFKAMEVYLGRFPDLSLCILGDNNRDKEGVFDSFRKKYSQNITTFGFVEERSDYWKQLGQCRVLPVTSIHDFLGLSVLEAISAGVLPLLPDRMVYPELIPDRLKSKLLYKGDLQRPLENLLTKGISEEDEKELLEHIQKFSAQEAQSLWKLKFSSQKPI